MAEQIIKGFTDQAAQEDLFKIEKHVSGLERFITNCNTPGVKYDATVTNEDNDLPVRLSDGNIAYIARFWGETDLSKLLNVLKNEPFNYDVNLERSLA